MDFEPVGDEKLGFDLEGPYATHVRFLKRNWRAHFDCGTNGAEINSTIVYTHCVSLWPCLGWIPLLSVYKRLILYLLSWWWRLLLLAVSWRGTRLRCGGKRSRSRGRRIARLLTRCRHHKSLLSYNHAPRASVCNTRLSLYQF